MQCKTVVSMPPYPHMFPVYRNASSAALGRSSASPPKTSLAGRTVLNFLGDRG